LIRVTTYNYDENDNLTKVIDADNNATDYPHDKNNRLTNILDARKKETRYAYNSMNLLDTDTNPIGKTYQYGYDHKGNLNSIKDPDNNETVYGYNDNSWLTMIEYKGATKVSFTEYDKNGNLKKMTDENGETSFTYDPLGRITSTNNSFGKTVSWKYLDSENRIKMTYPGNKEVNYYYDADNRLARVVDWLGGETKYTYDSAGILQSMVNPNGTKVIYSYDSASRLIGLSNKKSNNTIIATYSYTLDAAGNHIKVVKDEPIAAMPTVPNTLYTYDDANRLTSAGNTGYTYDSRGNLIGASNENGYSFDYADRLTGVTVNNKTIQYLYDGLGNRIARTQDGVQTRFVLDLNGPMSQVLAETDSSGNVIKYYIYGQGLISKITADGQRYCYHYDSRGSTVAITDSGENITDKYAYDEFGEVLAVHETNSNPFRYVGRYGVMDEGNGLLFMRARYYDVNTGRFLSKDPLRGELMETGSLNRYVYAMNNPIMLIDISGLSASDSYQSTLLDTVVDIMGKASTVAKFSKYAKISKALGPFDVIGKVHFLVKAVRLPFDMFFNGIYGVETDMNDVMEALEAAPVIGEAIQFYKMEKEAYLSLKYLLHMNKTNTKRRK
ncbi:hypothetical protein KKG56_01805, partial [bacterium]|nr:hypothetical protein [bacterium]